MNPKTALIYGLFKRGKCLYVGQTSKPSLRECALRSLFKRHLPFSFVRLKKVTVARRFLEEAKTIRLYKSKGQACLNKMVRKSSNTELGSAITLSDIDWQKLPTIKLSRGTAVLIDRIAAIEESTSTLGQRPSRNALANALLETAAGNFLKKKGA